jgi:putative transposase
MKVEEIAVTKRERRSFTDEFKNHLIDEVSQTFGIKRSLSMKGCPYDNAVSEATYKVIKTEFVRNQQFETFV